MDHLKSLIREAPDFPKPGILFYDITTLLKDGPGFHTVIDEFKERYRTKAVDLAPLLTTEWIMLMRRPAT